MKDIVFSEEEMENIIGIDGDDFGGLWCPGIDIEVYKEAVDNFLKNNEK